MGCEDPLYGGPEQQKIETSFVGSRCKKLEEDCRVAINISSSSSAHCTCSLRPELFLGGIHMSDSELGWLPNLSGSAAKLLLHALLSGGLEGATHAEHMRKSGVTSRATYFLARSQLAELGLPAKGWRLVQSGSENEPNWTPIGSENEPVWTPPVQRGSENEPVTVQSGSINEPIPPTGEDGSENEPDWLEQAEDIDSWPEDGRPGQKGTNWQKRRDAQVKLLSSCWGHYFPGSPPLTVDMAKQMLMASDNRVSEVLGVVIYASQGRKKPEYEKSYVLAALKRRKEEAARQPVVKPRVVDDDGMEQADPEFIASVIALNEQYKGMWGGDDD